MLPTGLSFAVIKITGEEYVVIQNNANADISDLSQYAVRSYNNVNPTATGVSTATEQLPATSLGRGQRLLLSSTIRSTCGASLAGKLTLSLTDSGGTVQIIKPAATPGTPMFVEDSLSWSSGQSGNIQSVPSSTKAPQATYYRYLGDNADTWQIADQDSANACQLNVSVSKGAVTEKVAVTIADIAPEDDTAPATIVFADDTQESTVADTALPDSYAGMMIPQITELLPNPIGSGNDVTDEYIELYNPNGSVFDLSGLTLQTGIASPRGYTFSHGAKLEPKSFTAFYSSETGLSLSNSGSRARLLDRTGKVLYATEQYGTAKEGQSWALAKGHWYWSVSPTPALPNIVTLKEAASRNSSKPTTVNAKTNTPAVTKKMTPSTNKAAKPPKSPKLPKAEKPKKQKSISTTPTAASVTARPIQTKIVALVAGIALLYGAYEYRADLANGIYKLRTNLRNRFATRR